MGGFDLGGFSGPLNELFMDINGGDKNRVFLHDLIKITEGTPLIPSEISRENARAWVSMDFK